MLSEMTFRQIRQSRGKSFTPVSRGVLQRKCACGTHSMAGGECIDCAKKKSGLQRKLVIGASSDPLEQEADRIADQVMVAPIHSHVEALSPDIQSFTGHTASQVGVAPPSVHRVLAGSGRSLQPTLQDEMERRFGHDFSKVRVYTGDAAEQSARDVNAHAYTVGHNIVFGASQFAPGTHIGRRLIAHELTHVVQQRVGLVPASEKRVARASVGEMWDAVTGVGPIDAYRASTLADEALAAANATGLSGLHNGPADAWRHCFWNCNMTHALGYDQAETIANNHEQHGGGPANENQMDLFNNEVGRDCGGTDCDGCCQRALDAGQLRIIDSTGAVVPSTVTPRGGPTRPGTTYSRSNYSTLPPASRPRIPIREPIERCFTGRMLVTMADGKKMPLEQVVVGDRVLAYDETMQCLREGEVIACHKHSPAEYLKVWLMDGQLLEVTWNHHIYANGSWLQAGQLRAGSLVHLRGRGEEELMLATVERIESADQTAPLFDITVADCHNYFVSGVLVHNKNI